MRQIECLACGSVRVAFGTTLDQTGECPRCRYLGWTYSDDLDSTTQRMITGGRLANRPFVAARPTVQERRRRIRVS